MEEYVRPVPSKTSLWPIVGSRKSPFSVLIMLLILASSGIYLIEQEIQPHAFGSIPDAMWWAMATLTTVGYGDVTPITPMGKFFGGCITIVGVGMVALPAGILASGFAAQLHRRRQEFEDNLHAVYEDGLLSDEEEQQLEELRCRLGLSQEDTEQLSKVYVRKLTHNLRQCPHCHKPLVKQRSSDSI